MFGQIRIPRWRITELTGYEPKTTFWEDFSIADGFGLEAIQDTYNRAFRAWADDYIYITELVMVLNHKIWQHHQNNSSYARLYQSLWEEADIYASEHLEGEELAYYYRTLD